MERLQKCFRGLGTHRGTALVILIEQSYILYFQVVNLSYQNLGDEYQLRNFHRCLSRLHLCKRLQLMDNSLSSIKKVTLPSCVYLNLSRNRITSFTSLPMSPNLEHLSIANNNIVSMTNLQSLARKYPHLKTLTMKGNPAADAPDYRYRYIRQT